MPTISKKNVLAVLLCLQLLPYARLSSVENAESSNPPTISPAATPLTSSSSLLPSITACESRTANYITHNLPQQCLRANWTRSINRTTSANEDLKNPDLSSASIHAADNTSAAGTEGDKTAETPSPASGPEEQPPEPTSILHATQESTTTQEHAESEPSSSSPDSTSREAEAETDSPLDNAKFLSFEEWKKQNLAKIGQSPENIGQGRASASDGRKRPSHINNALDSLGEEGEIDLEFGFGPRRADDSSSRWSSQPQETVKVADADSEPTAASGSRGNRRDAGTTWKERFNYASFDCAATILKTNPQCTSSSSVLVENQDSYMLNECAEKNKFLIVELCDDILIDTIVLANFEFFSSMFRTFRVSISDRYPVKTDRWKELGVFEARNSREIQAFAVENPLIWARYLRIEFLTHYGNEFYCPVSLLRVHGTTMMEEFKSQDEPGRSDDEVESEEAEPEDLPNNEHPSEYQSAPEPPSTEEQKAVSTGESESPEMHYEQGLPTIAGNLSDLVPNSLETNSSQSDIPSSPTVPITSSSIPSSQRAEASANETTTSAMHPERSALSDGDKGNATASITSATTTTPASESSVNSTSTSNANNTTLMADSPSALNMSLSASTLPTDNGTTSKPSQAAQESSKTPSSSVQAPAASPTTQESFFKSVHKRLQMLEANSTLSLQYIEEQSRILRDAFTKVEKRQMSKAETFLQNLNDTVVTELKGFRQQYDQLWQSTVIELETHREQYQREMSALSTRLTLMADELVFQKRMAVVQSTLLLLCLGLVLFVRSGTSSLELPLMQQVMNKSHSMLRLQVDSPPGSPSSRGTSPPSKARSFFGASNSRDSDASAGSPSPPPNSRGKPIIELAPATPSDDDEETMMDLESPGDGLDAPVVRQTQSGPATPSSMRESQNLLEWIDGEEGQSLSPPLVNGDRAANSRRQSRLRYAESLEDDVSDGEGGRGALSEDL